MMRHEVVTLQSNQISEATDGAIPTVADLLVHEKPPTINQVHNTKNLGAPNQLLVR